MPWHTRHLHFVLPQANVFATWLSENIELKSSDLLSQERNEYFAMTTLTDHIISAFFAASFSVRERMDICLELLLGWFSVCPAVNAAFSVELWFGRHCSFFRPLACESRAFLL